MRLILSSCDFHNPHSRSVILAHLPKPITQCRVLFIPNERASAQAIRSERFILRLMNCGFSRENITILDYYHAERYADLALDVIYMAGGNTFATLRRLRMHGFDSALAAYIRTGVTYIGGSCGAHIVSKDIAHLSVYDPVPADMTDFHGLSLFDGICICHFGQERRAHYEALVKSSPFPVFPLTNEDALVVDDAGCHLCLPSEGKEEHPT